MKHYNWLDPILHIKESDLPLVVLEDDRRSFMGFFIKNHTSGNYHHIMEMHKLGYVATQNFNGFREVSILNYMKPSKFLKFWKVKGMTLDEKEEWVKSINKDLASKMKYDFLGVIGQLLRVRWIQSPWAKYCSEQVGNRLRKVFKILIKDLNYRRTPSEIDEFMKKYSYRVGFEPLGYWWSD